MADLRGITTKISNFGSNPRVKGKLQAHLYYNKKRRLARITAEKQILDSDGEEILDSLGEEILEGS